MPNLTSVTLNAGVPNSGTGTVSTIDALMAIQNANGQTTMTNSSPVVIASNQSAIPVTVPVGQAAMAASTPVVLASNQTSIPVTVPVGQAAMAASTPVVLASNQTAVPVSDNYAQYETVAASATAQVVGATGAAGDYLAYVMVFPGIAGCGVVTILDNAVTWGTFAGGGTTALPSLIPFRIDVGAFSVSGAWKITTGASVTATAVGRFT